MLEKKIISVNEDFEKDISNVSDLKQLEEVRIKYLSRNGIVADLFENLKNASKEEKPILGKNLNALRNDITTKFNS